VANVGQILRVTLETREVAQQHSDQLQSEELGSHEAKELCPLAVALTKVESIPEMLLGTNFRHAPFEQQLIFKDAEHGVKAF